MSVSVNSGLFINVVDNRHTWAYMYVSAQVQKKKCQNFPDPAPGSERKDGGWELGYHEKLLLFLYLLLFSVLLSPNVHPNIYPTNCEFFCTDSQISLFFYFVIYTDVPGTFYAK